MSERPPIAGGVPAPAGAPGDGPEGAPGSWLWAHIGRLSGLLLGLLALAGTVLLAAAGFTPAYLLIVLVLGVMVMIVAGGRLRGT